MSDAIRWLKVVEAADRARCGPKTIYRAVRSRQLRAVRVGGRRELRFLESWVDCWLLGNQIEGSEQNGSLERRVAAAIATCAPTSAATGHR
jgi:excisionase family DNA binding protein